jgi:hypothetical protein
LRHSTKRCAARKPSDAVRSKRKADFGLPPQFPLLPQASGRWAKKVRGQPDYFGQVADDARGEAALWLLSRPEIGSPIGRRGAAGTELQGAPRARLPFDRQ